MGFRNYAIFITVILLSAATQAKLIGIPAHAALNRNEVILTVAETGSNILANDEIRAECDGNCENGGQCNISGDAKFCVCKAGTSGDRCSIVNDCQKRNFCGTKSDADCVYDESIEGGTCKCKDDTKMFHPTEKECKTQCDNNCENGGQCNISGDAKFCDCKVGTSGDLCIIVNDCQKQNFCGAGTNVECVYDESIGGGTCNCKEDTKMFYRTVKECIIPCYDKCENNGECNAYGDVKFCACKEGTSGDFCSIVKNCDQPDVCGTKRDVECVYDQRTSRGICKCKDDQKMFHLATKECINTPVPRNLTVASFTSKSIFLTWQDPESLTAEHNYNYVVQRNRNIFWELKTSRTFYNVTDLSTFSGTFRVRVQSAAVLGPWSEEVKARTDSYVSVSPCDISILSSTNTSLSVSWDRPEINTGAMTRFKVQWLHSNALSFITGFAYGETSYTITNLTPYTEYKVRLRAETDTGSGYWTPEFSAVTGIGGVPSQIMNAVTNKVTATSITFLFWGPRYTGGLAITHYVMRYEKQSGGDFVREIEWEIGTPYIVQHLKTNSEYRFRVSARNQVGKGPWSNLQILSTSKATVPEPPLIRTKTEIVSRYPDTYEVSWEAPDDDGRPLFIYKIHYFQVKRDLKGWNQVQKPEEQSVDINGPLSFQLTGLIPDSYYKIEIRALNALGCSAPESVIIMTNKEGEYGSTANITGSTESTNSTTDSGDISTASVSDQTTSILSTTESGDDLKKVTREIILISISSATLVLIAVIASCLLCFCIRNRKTY